MAKILLVEDDADVAEMIEDCLKREHHLVEWANNGGDALHRLKSYVYDIVVLDINLPNMSGLEVLKEFRGRGGSTPVLMLTGKNTVTDKELGLDTGADDYLTKPFDGRELSARIRALLRRIGVIPSNKLSVRNLVLDPVTYKVTRDQNVIELLPREFSLLEFFMRHPDQIFSVEALLDRVWTADKEASADAVRMCIQRLRKKLDRDNESSFIKTVHRVGYVLES